LIAVLNLHWQFLWGNLETGILKLEVPLKRQRETWICSSGSLIPEFSGWNGTAYDKGQTHGELLVIIDKSFIQLTANICGV
jgi:hypothetical protein